jgi:hypothetical protein
MVCGFSPSSDIAPMKQPIEQVTELLESLPRETQARVAELLRDLVEDARNEARWTELVQRGAELFTAVRVTRDTIEGGPLGLSDPNRRFDSV